MSFLVVIYSKFFALIMVTQLSSTGYIKSKDNDEFKNRLRKSRSLGSLNTAAKHNPETVKWNRGQFTWSMSQSAHNSKHYNEETNERSNNYKDANIRDVVPELLDRQWSDIPGYSHYLEHHGTLPFICWIAMCCGLCIPCCCFCCEYFEEYSDENMQNILDERHKNTKHATICNRNESDIEDDTKPLLVATNNESIAGCKESEIATISSYQSVENGKAMSKGIEMQTEEQC